MEELKHFDVDGHKITPMRDPETRLAAVLQLIGEAKNTIKMFTYMFAEDETGQEVMNALISAQKRGVSVELMIDSFGSGDAKEKFFEPLTEAGGIYRCFSARWNMGYFVRNHQKILVADGARAIIGGFNITDNYFGRSGDNSWEDFGIVIEGPTAQVLVEYYDQLVGVTKGKGVRFRTLRQLIRRWHREPGPVHILLGGPTNRVSPWARQLKRDLESGERIDLVSAYFSPSQSVLRRISRVTRKNKGSRLVLAGRTDNKATIPAARSLYKYLLKRGASIFEFQAQPLHMKLVIIDDAVYVGSSNLDIRSLFINMEIMVRIEDPDFAVHMRTIVDDMCAHSEEQTLALHSKRSGIFARIKQGIAYLLVNSVDYTIGRRIKFSLLKRD